MHCYLFKGVHTSCFLDSSLTYIFRVYFRGQSGPALLLLHGGGHSALSWAVFSVSTVHDCMIACTSCSAA